ncbi:MAG: NHL repeat-containing protein [Deinococcota bacterium]
MGAAKLKPAPIAVLGAPSSGSLALPPAHPTPTQMYCPRGVFLCDEALIVADSGNHRVLIWFGPASCLRDNQPADVVLGQPDFYSEGEQLFKLPTGVGVYGGNLYVADAWHHRILVWRSLPHETCPPDWVIGQDSLEATLPNRGGSVGRNSFYWPFGIGYVRNRFYVCDTGNRRVVWWEGLPEPGQPPDGLLGQDDWNLAHENRGSGVGPCTFRWPHGVAGDGKTLYIADAGNHRVLGWNQPAHDRPADLLLGQPHFQSTEEFAYIKQGPSRLRFPYAVALEGNLLVVADTANNRVLLWQGPPRSEVYTPAQAVLGQENFEDNGENHWKAITPYTLCWPYGLWLYRGILAVCDSGNNRVVVWKLHDYPASRLLSEGGLSVV